MSSLTKRWRWNFDSPSTDITAWRSRAPWPTDAQVEQDLVLSRAREHFTVLGIRRRPFQVDSPWFSGQAEIGIYGIEELLGTKLRALYQRKKGRDLYDLWLSLTSLTVDDAKVVDCFQRYLEHDGLAVSRAEFEENMNGKLRNRSFLEDIEPLLPTGVSYDVAQAGALVGQRLIEKLHGDPWKGAEDRRSI